MGPFGSLLVVAVALSLLGKAFVYPRSPRGLDAFAVVIAGAFVLHLGLESPREWLLLVYLLGAGLVVAVVRRWYRPKAFVARGSLRRWLFRAACAVGIATVVASASLLAVLTPLVQDPDAVFTALRREPPDYSSMGWLDAFEALHGRLEQSYAFGEWKGIAWDELERKCSPEIAAAERDRDFAKFYRALREYAYSFPDGHVGVAGDDRGARRAAIGGRFGLGILRLDDGSAFVHVLTPNGPAVRAGITFGAQVLSWNGRPVEEAAAQVPLVWAEEPPATRDGRRLERYRLLSRAPIGVKVELLVRNPEDGEPRHVSLTAEDDGLEGLALTDPRPRLRLREPVVTWSVRPDGIAYLRILGEVPTLATLFPDREVHRAFEDFSKHGVDKLVLDVRGNGGGFDKLVPAMMGHFFDEPALYEQASFAGESGGFVVAEDKTLYVAPKEPHFSGALVVLVDDRTVSSGEGFPMLARRLAGAHVVGFTGTHGSFGMSGATVRLPESLVFYYPDGRSLDANGVIQLDSNARLEGGVDPDVRIPADEDTVRAQWRDGNDVALETAIRLFSR